MRGPFEDPAFVAAEAYYLMPPEDRPGACIAHLGESECYCAECDPGAERAEAFFYDWSED